MNIEEIDRLDAHERYQEMKDQLDELDNSDNDFSGEKIVYHVLLFDRSSSRYWSLFRRGLII